VLYAGKNIPNRNLSVSPVLRQELSSKSILSGKTRAGVFMFALMRDAKKIYPNSGDGEINVRG
jgi:hypothetical protein